MQAFMRLISKTLRLLLAIWLCLTLWYAAVDRHGHGDRTYARIWAAGEEAFRDLPGTILFGIAIIRDAWFAMRRELTWQLGRDPLDINTAGIPAPSNGAVPDLGLGVAGSLALTMAAALMATQFLISMFAVGMDGGAPRQVGWRAPGMIRFQRPRARLAYMAIITTVAFALVILALGGGLLAGALSIALLGLLMRYPLGAVPVWLLDALGLRPRLDLLAAAGRRAFSRGMGAAGSKGRWRSSAGPERGHSTPGAVAPDMTYKTACSLLFLRPNSFSQQELSERRQMAMRASHPDVAGGSHDAAIRLQQAYETCLRHHGWAR